MEDNPQDSWTTVDRKTSKKKSKVDCDSSEGGWSQAAKDRRRKDSGGPRHERNNDRRGGERRGERGKPPVRGGSTHRNTLPRKQSQRDGVGWTSQRSSPSPAPQQHGAQSHSNETLCKGNEATEKTVRASENEKSDRKCSWAKMISHPEPQSNLSSKGSPLHSQKVCNVRNFPQTENPAKKNIDPSIDSLPLVSTNTDAKGVVGPPAEIVETSKPSTSDELIPPCTNELTSESTGCESLRPIQDINKVPSNDRISMIEKNLETQLSSNPSNEIKDELIIDNIDTCSTTAGNDCSNVSLENVEICNEGLMLSIDSKKIENLKESSENIDSNGNNVVLDKNKNETASEKSEEHMDETEITNPETRHYDRDVLLQLQKHPLSLQKPDKLPELEIVLDSPMRSSSSAPTIGEIPSQYVHTFSRGGAPTKRDSRRKEVKKIISLSREPVKLHKADNAWLPGKKTVEEKNSDLEVLLKRVRAILNKLTPQKFSTLVVQFQQLDIDNEEKLVSCMELVFEKALDEPVFSQAYANMCKELFLKGVVKDNSNEKVDFRMLLLRRCQKEFEKDYLSEDERKKYMDKLSATESEEESKKINEEFQQLELKMRKRSLGNIRFIGELYKLQLIKGKILHSIIKKLLLDVDEESMECLCRLLTTCGSNLEAEIKTIDETTRHLYQLDTFFDQMQEIIKQKKTTSRIRFLLQDTIDLRKKNWISRRQEAGPKTIEQIHKEAKLEALRIETEDQRSDIPPVGRRSEERSRRKTDFRPKPIVDDGNWSNVPNKAAKISDIVDPERLRMKKVDADSLKLGPSMGRGFASAGSSTPKQTAETINSFNRFQMLEAESVEQNFKYSGRASEPLRSTSDQNEERSRRSPSKENTRESKSAQHRNFDQIEKGKSSKLEGDRNCNPDELRHKYKTILEEYINNCDFKETLSSVCEMFHSETMKYLVEETFNIGLEKLASDQERCGDLLAALMQEECLYTTDICSGVGVLLEFSEDIAIDIPKFWEFTSRILAVLLVKTNCWGDLVENCCSFLPPDVTRLPFINSLLHAVKLRNEEIFIQITVQFKESLEKLLCQNLETFLSDNNWTSSITEQLRNKTEGTLVNGNLQEDIHRKISAVFAQKQTANDELSKIDEILSDIVMDNVTVRTVVTAVIESAVKGIGGPSVHCTLDEKILTDRISVLKKYIDANKDRELSALYAIQHLVSKLEHPNKLLHTILELLYDKECISEEGLFEWEKSDDPEEQEGKGVALKSCNQFFNWLRTADEEDDDQVVDGGSINAEN